VKRLSAKYYVRKSVQ